eukprot:2951460-Rhodomonas_salina.1
MAWAWSVPQTWRSQSHSWLTRPKMSGLMAEHVFSMNSRERLAAVSAGGCCAMPPSSDVVAKG